MVNMQFDKFRRGWVVDKASLPKDFDICPACFKKVEDFSDCLMCETTKRFFHRDCCMDWDFRNCAEARQSEHEHIHIVEVREAKKEEEQE
ncbi:MAG: hypothetical protein B6229_00330 [Spirochaetaceae bacterium 4572_7]|nr:MAG: hypothetical protein B6229_00330 [Spirochaetaceae bacterium 4572_7]